MELTKFTTVIPDFYLEVWFDSSPSAPREMVWDQRGLASLVDQLDVGDLFARDSSFAAFYQLIFED